MAALTSNTFARLFGDLPSSGLTAELVADEGKSYLMGLAKLNQRVGVFSLDFDSFGERDVDRAEARRQPVPLHAREDVNLAVCLCVCLSVPQVTVTYQREQHCAAGIPVELSLDLCTVL